MPEVNPYQKPAGDKRPPRRKKKPFDPEAAGLPREPLRVMLGLVFLLGAVLGAVVGSAGLALVDHIKPISWFIFSDAAEGALMTVFSLATTALAWLAWTLRKKAYPWRSLALFIASGWAVGLLCLAAIVRADRAAEQRLAEAACAGISAQPGVTEASTEALVDRCESDFLHCRRWLKRQEGYAELTSDAETTMMKTCRAAPPR